MTKSHIISNKMYSWSTIKGQDPGKIDLRNSTATGAASPTLSG